MKKYILFLSMALIFVATVHAGVYLNLASDIGYFPANTLLDASKGGKISYFNGSVGYGWDNGLFAGVRYDHMGLDDYTVGAMNVRVVAAIPGVEGGYYARLMDNKLLWWTAARFGYAVSARYRLNTTNYKGSAIVPAVSTALFYQLLGQFYGGIEMGYRYFVAEYPDLSGAKLNLSGLFIGVSIIHLLN